MEGGIYVSFGGWAGVGVESKITKAQVSLPLAALISLVAYIGVAWNGGVIKP